MNTFNIEQNDNTQQTLLYPRNFQYIPRVAAVHDICGYGNCSLAVAMPVLSAAGIDVCPVPTAVFSSHTKYKDFSFLDTTNSLHDFLEKWQKINVHLDGIYSGFLGSAEQVSLIKQLYATYPKALRIVDPVMGDAGIIYPTYTDELCAAMCELAKEADLLTPNLTEASILTGLEYKGQHINDEDLTELCSALANLGAKYIVLKGVIRGQHIVNYLITADNKVQAFKSDLLDFNLHGTGDLYCSSLLAAVFAGKSLDYAVDFAATMVVESMKISKCQPDFEMRGVNFESRLALITNLLPQI